MGRRELCCRRDSHDRGDCDDTGYGNYVVDVRHAWNLGASVTLTATVSPTTSTSAVPSGNLSFYDAGSLLVTTTLSGGKATYTSSTLAAGTHTITAVYAGDSNFSTSTAGALSEVVNAPGLTLAANPSGLSIVAGTTGRRR